MVERVFHHGVHYPDNHNIPLSDVAATLIAYDRLAPILGRLLEELSPGLDVQKVIITVDNIHAGSLSEAFLVAIFVSFQKSLDREVPKLVESLTGLEISKEYDTLVTVLLLIILFYGAKYLFEGGRQKKADVPPSIAGDNNTYVNIAAERIGTNPEEIEQAVKRAVGKRDGPRVAKAAIDFFRPAKRGTNGRIAPAGTPEISEASTASFPSEATLSMMEDNSVPLPVAEAILEIRATDRDKAEHGWAGKLQMAGFTTKRLPLKLYPTVDREELSLMETAPVEAVLEQKPTDDGDLKPVAIHVIRILTA